VLVVTARVDPQVAGISVWRVDASPDFASVAVTRMSRAMPSGTASGMPSCPVRC